MGSILLGRPPSLNMARIITKGILKLIHNILNSQGLLIRFLLEAFITKGAMPDAIAAIQAKSISIFIKVYHGNSSADNRLL